MRDDPQGAREEQDLVLGHFTVQRRPDGALWELGRGAMGVTYRAFDKNLRTEVALKVIRSEKVRDEPSRLRFQREARAAAKIRHVNVASVLYLGEQDGACFYAMEYVRGRSLEAVLQEHGGKLPPAVALALIAQAAAGLKAAHREGVVHRDLKPANLMLMEGEALTHEDERTAAAGNRLLKVIDFGLARHFGAGHEDESVITQHFPGFVGTPAYSSPEQCMEAEVDGRTDLYSLGVILWQLLTGKKPFGGRSWQEAVIKHLNEPPPLEHLKELPLPVAELLEGLLIKDRALRKPQAAAELGLILDRLWKNPESGRKGNAAPGSPPSGENHRVSAPFPITQAPEGLDSLFEIGERLPRRGVSAFLARETATGKEVELVVIGSDGSPANGAGELAAGAGWSRAPGAPEALLRVGAVICAPGCAAYTEEHFPHLILAEELQRRSAARRPVAFREALPVLRQVAGAVDFIAQGAGALLHLGCGDVRLLRGGPADGDTGWLCERRVKCSAMGGLLPGACPGPEEPDAATATLSNSPRSAGRDECAGAVLARLAYRILAGSEVSAAARVAPEAFVPAIQLGKASNDLVRDLVSGRCAPMSAMEFLRAACRHEGAPFGTDPVPPPARNDGHAPSPPPPPPPPPPPRFRAWIAAAALVAVMLAGGLWWRSRDPTPSQVHPLVPTQPTPVNARSASSPGGRNPPPAPTVGQQHSQKDLPGPGSVAPAAPPPRQDAGMRALPAQGSPQFAPRRPENGSEAPGFFETAFENDLGMRFAPVPIAGGPSGGASVLFAVWDTRVQDYDAYLKATGATHEAPSFKQGPTHPVVVVSWNDAVAFCAWLTIKEHQNGRLPRDAEYRLPTDREWSCAVGIGATESANGSPKEKNGATPGYPWDFTADLRHGWPPPVGAGNYADETAKAADSAGVSYIDGYRDGYAYTSPVGSFSPNKYGLYDMGGNVWQWCQDKYDPAEAGESASRVLRGASWGINDEIFLRSSCRFYVVPSFRYVSRGFRVVVAVVRGG